MSETRQEGRWWRGDTDPAKIIEGLRDQIETGTTARRDDYRAMRAMYLDKEFKKFEKWSFHRRRVSRFNLIQGAVDATHAQIVASRPRPKIVTIAEDHYAQRKAVLRQRWLDGEFDRLRVYDKLSHMCLDALIYGTGVLKVSPENGRPVVDRVWAGDIWMDPREERYGRPMTLYQVHAIDRDVLIAEYPEHEDEIENIPGLSAKADMFADYDNERLWENPHQVAVIEAWRLPAGKDSPGRHVSVAGSLLLIDEEWTHEKFPFVFFPWAEDPERFWGQGMVARAAGMQSDLNELTDIIQQSYEVMVPQLWVDESAGVQADLDDEVGRINFCKPGAGGIQSVVMAISPEVGPGLLQREQVISDRFLPVLGVDMLAARAEKPAGLNSGTAIQNYHDQVSQRFLPQGRRYEQASPDVADLLFFFADKLAEAGHDEAVRAYGKGSNAGIELIEYSQIKPDEGEVFETRVKPGSALPKDIAGRIQTVFDMQALGLPELQDPARVAELIEMPDTEGLMDQVMAGRNLVARAIALCTMTEEPQPQANSYWPLETAMGMVTTAVQMADLNNADEEVLTRLRNLHGQLRSMPDPNAPPPLPPDAEAPAIPTDPMAAGVPPPMMPPPAPLPPGPPIQ